METVFFDIKSELEKCFDAQANGTDVWHTSEPDSIGVIQGNSPEALMSLVLAQHLMNFRLWHVEDIARRKDVGPEVIADCKYRIDKLNQQRNDFMEKVDAALLERLLPALPEAEGVARMNTESLGMSVDRLSILSLKIYHMKEQTERNDTTESHMASCQEKLAVLNEQRRDLIVAVLELIDDYSCGIKRPKVYYQCKMYNDPTLNPELYKAQGD